MTTLREKYGLPIKVRHDDMKRLSIVSSRFDQHQKIKTGKLRPPNKDGDNMQSTAWWWGDEIAEDLEAEKAEKGAEAA